MGRYYFEGKEVLARESYVGLTVSELAIRAEGLRETYAIIAPNSTNPKLKFELWNAMRVCGGVVPEVPSDSEPFVESLDKVIAWCLAVEKPTSPVSSTTAGETKSIQTPINPEIAKLPKSWRAAWLALEGAMKKKGEVMTYANAWDWMNEFGSDDNALPAKRTFCDYCAKAATRLGQQRKTSRGGRTGRSIVKSSDI